MRAVSFLAVALVSPFVVAGCGGGGTDDPPRLTASMCDAAKAAASGRLQEARAIFDDRHAELHELAAEVSDVDRAKAATLLRAKEKVESDLRAVRPVDLAQDLESLASAVGAAEGGARSDTCR